ncbi:MAG: polysaccharide pyruvyl transferase family protein [Acidimicrobiia bacterium]
MPEVLIVGAFGQQNPGDEALLDAGLALVGRLPGWEPIVVSADPAGTTARTGARSVTNHPAAVGREVARLDGLVVAGGTVFKELHPLSARRPGSLLRRGVALARAVRARGKPVVAVGVGAAPTRAAAQGRVRHLAAAADLLVLRDDASARILVGSGVPGPLRVGADLAWDVVPDLPGLRPAPERPGELVVAVSALAGGAELARLLVRRLEPLCLAGWEVVLEPWQGPPRLGPDARLAHDVARRLAGRVRVGSAPEDLAAAVHAARERRVVVAMRFHAALAAAAAGTPFVAVAHEPKLAALAERFGQPVVTPTSPPDHLAAAVALAVEGPGPDPATAARERQRAAAMVDLARLVLAGRGEPDGLEHLALVPDPVTV